MLKNCCFYLVILLFISFDINTAGISPKETKKMAMSKIILSDEYNKTAEYRAPSTMSFNKWLIGKLGIALSKLRQGPAVLERTTVDEVSRLCPRVRDITSSDPQYKFSLESGLVPASFEETKVTE